MSTATSDAPMMRASCIVPLECRAQEPGQDERPGWFSGYASVFGVRDSHGDIVMAGAFKRSLRELKRAKQMPALLWQHDAALPVGVWLDMREDARGLYVEGQLADTTLGRDARELLRLGAITGLSIGYVPRRVKFRESPEHGEVREVLDVDLWETSLVTFPSNTESRVLSAKGALPSERLMEQWLRDAGLSREQAQTVISKGYRHVVRDASTSAEDTREDATAPALAAAVAHALSALRMMR